MSQRLSVNARTLLEDTEGVLTVDQRTQLTKAREALLEATERLQNAAESIVTSLKRDPV